ncbi:MAG: VCBS repeat-containing protein, partial [Woeseiaceae bacterium]
MFSITEAPQHGSLLLDPAQTTDNSAMYLYTPDPDFHGEDGFAFNAHDGVEEAESDLRVDLAIAALPDIAVIDPAGPFTAARGFPRVVNATYSDVDNDPAREPQAIYIDWGDDTVAQPAGKDWINTGNTDAHGTALSPQIEFGINRGILLGSHQYDAVGSYTIEFAMRNPGNFTALPDSFATASVEVIDATAVAMRLQAPASPVMPVDTFPLLVEIRNFAPDGWAGLDATSVSASIEVPEGLNIVAVDPRCTSAQPMVCDLGTLAPDQSSLLTFAASIDLDNALEQAEYLLQIEIRDDGPTISERNIAVGSISISERDADGAIDVDDAFPDDPSYSVDSDGDGLADEWESEYGFDPLTADDTSSDTDGDGYTLLQEFLHGSYANLGEFEQFDTGTRLESPNNDVEDRMGLAMTSADLNQDGFSELVIGASVYGSTGAVFISYGSESGASSDLQQLRPAGSLNAMGRALASGDWDDNGYPDIAIAVNNAVLIHYNFGEIVATPDRTLAAANGSGAYALGLMSADMDGDGIDDLIVNRHNNATTTSIEIYGSVAGGIDAAPAVFAINDGYFAGQAIGDVDGDGSLDLVLGALASQTVRGYLASDNSWQPGSGLTSSFELAAVAGQSQFGHALASGHDVTGDGIDDLVVGSYSGVGYINLFDSASEYWTDNGAAPLQTINGLGAAAGTGDTHPDQFGVSIAMDYLDSDGYADIVVGANRAG